MHAYVDICVSKKSQGMHGARSQYKYTGTRSRCAFTSFRDLANYQRMRTAYVLYFDPFNRDILTRHM